MSSFTLKCIALITMIIDHIGAVFFPDLIWIRYIGRISFPIYAFLLAQGFAFTKNKKRYAMRLAVFAIASEIPYDLLFYQNIFEPQHQNILFELLCGLFVLACLENFFSKCRGGILWLFAALLLTLSSSFLGFSYGIYGICLMVVFWLLRRNTSLSSLSGAAVTVLFNGIASIKTVFLGRTISFLSLNSVQLYAVAASLPIFFYNGKKGAYSLKWFFYIIYPLHLIILCLIRFLINSPA